MTTTVKCDRCGRESAALETPPIPGPVGAEVQQYVQGFLRSTSGLTTVGFLVLIITSLLLMSTHLFLFQT